MILAWPSFLTQTWFLTGTIKLQWKNFHSFIVCYNEYLYMEHMETVSRQRLNKLSTVDVWTFDLYDCTQRMSLFFRFFFAVWPRLASYLLLFHHMFLIFWAPGCWDNTKLLPFCQRLSWNNLIFGMTYIACFKFNALTHLEETLECMFCCVRIQFMWVYPCVCVLKLLALLKLNFMNDLKGQVKKVYPNGSVHCCSLNIFNPRGEGGRGF